MAPSPFSGRRADGAAQSDALDRVALLALLDGDLRQRVRKCLIRKKLQVGKPLFRQGEAAGELYLVESGRLRVSVGERAGQERVLQFVGAGDIIGEAAFMAETPHVTNAVAVEDGTVWRLGRSDFDTLLSEHEGSMRYLAGVIAERQGQANARLAAKSAPDAERASRGYVTAVYSPRGGAGVTTLAVNLAIALAERLPEDTVLLDLDVLFGHAVANLWLHPRGVLAELPPATMRALDRQGLDYYLLRHSSSLRVLPAANRPEDGQSITGEHVRATVSTLCRNFGHVVLDLAHGFNEVTLAGLELADSVVLVATPEPSSVPDILECQRIFGQILHLTPDRLTCVLNHPQPYSAVSKSEFDSATGASWSEVGHGGEAPTAAASRGESLQTTRPNSPVVRGTAKLAEQIARQAREAATLVDRPL